MGGEFGDLTVGGQVAPAGLPVWQAGPVLFPVGEGGLVAIMVQPGADVQVWLGVYEGWVVTRGKHLQDDQSDRLDRRGQGRENAEGFDY